MIQKDKKKKCSNSLFKSGLTNIFYKKEDGIYFWLSRLPIVPSTYSYFIFLNFCKNVKASLTS